MIENAKSECNSILKEFNELKSAHSNIIYYSVGLIHELFMDEDGEQILERIADAELYNRSFEKEDSDPNTWENWMLDEIKIENSHVFFIYVSDNGSTFSARLEDTDIDFLEKVINYINSEL